MVQKKLIVEIVKIQSDGTVEVDLTKDSPVASELLELHQFDRMPSAVDYIFTDHNKSVPKLKIAVLVVGTRGDVQPFLAVARRLQVRHKFHVKQSPIVLHPHYLLLILNENRHTVIM